MRNRFTLSGSFLLIAILFSGVFAQSSTVSKSNPASAKETAKTYKTSKPVSMEKIESDVAEALTIIESNHVKGKKLDYNDLFKSSIDSMLHTLDPHSNYFDAQEFEQFRTSQSSQYFGIGATIGDLSDAQGNVIGTYVKATFDGAPANRAGLRYGDKIVEVNGVSMIGKPYFDVREFLRGPRGTPAKLVVERFNTGKRESVEIIRDAVSQPSIAESYMIKPRIGYMAMTGGFNYTTYNEFREAMKQLKAQGMEQLVIDLRNNGGGLVNQAFLVANTFLGSGQTIFTQKGRVEGSARTFQAENDVPENMPIVVLVNRNTASASEILAGALQDHDRALIVGENTFGKGLVQNPFMLDYGSMLLLTIAKYETPSGRLIQRDYSDGNLYNYYYKGGSFYDEGSEKTPTGEQKQTDSGRAVYGGGGIMPDENVKAQTIATERARFQAKLNDPIFAYALNLTFGKTQGYESYKVDRPIVFDYDIKSNDFAVTDKLFEDFKKFAVEKYKFTPAQIDRERDFVQRILRTELVTAAYGATTSFQVFNDYDNQLQRAIELLPEARQLAIKGAQAKIQKDKSKTNK
ncbi:MAG: S41 family peptidase [Pyrinomonadaceae bacterium]